MSDVKNKRVNIYIDQTSAEDALTRLQSKADGFNNKIEKCRQQQTKLLEEIKKSEAAGKDVTALQNKYETLGTRINAYNKSLQETQSQQAKVKQQIDSGISPSFAQLERYVNSLRNELKNLSQDAPGYAKKFEAFQKSSQQLNQLRDAMNGVERAQKSWLSDAKTVAFGVLIGNGVQTAIGAISGYVSGIVTGNAKMSDSIAKVRQTTGLTTAEVKDLANELKGIDTRTAQSDLLKIAEIGGQFNVAKEQLGSFVKEIDKANVVLGSEFGGGAEQITTELALLRNVFTDIKSEHIDKDLGHIGNALVGLAQEGAATAPVISDFSKRLSPLIATAKLTSGQILGMGAAMQELAVNPERGGTAVVKLFDKMISNADAFAKVAGVGVKEFKEQLQNNSFDAFTKVLEGFKKGGDNVVALNSVIGELEVSGVGAKEVLVKLSENIELVGDRSKMATELLKSNAKINEQFTINNTTLGAELDKLGKKFSSFIQSETLTNFFIGSIRAVGKFIDILKDVPKFLNENKVAIYFLLAGLALMNLEYIKTSISISKKSIATLFDTTITKLSAYWDDVSRKAKVAYYIVVDLVTGKIKLATAAQEIWVYVMESSLGPIGILIAAISAIAIAISLLPTSYSAAQKAAKDLAEVQAEATKSITQEKVQLEALLKVAKDETQSKEKRQKAIDAINKEMPEYIENLTLENINTEAGNKIILQYIEALGKKALAQAYMTKLQDLYNKQIDQENTSLEDNVKWYNALWNSMITGGNMQASAMLNVKTGIENKQEAKKSLQDEIAILQKSFDADIKSGKATIDFGTKPTADKKTTTTVTDGTTDEEKKKRDDLLKKLQDFKFELEQVGKDADEKEVDRIRKKYDELIKEATKHGIGLVGLEAEKNRAIAFLIEKDRQEQIAKRDKAFKDIAAKHYDETQKETQEQFELLKQAEAKKYADGLIDKKQYEINVQTIEVASKQQQLDNAIDYSANVKKAEADVLVFKKQITAEEIQEAIKKREKLVENEKLLYDLKKKAALASLENKVLNTVPDSEENFKAKKNLRAEKQKQELAEVERQEKEYREKGIVFTDEFEKEKDLIRSKYRDEEDKVERERIAKKITSTLNSVQQVLGILDQFNQARNAKEKAALDKELKANDDRRKSIQKLAASKQITEIESRRQLAALDIEEQKRKDDLEKRQNERNKRMAIAQAIINGALAVTKILAETPKFDFGVATAIQIALAVATTAAQIATISSTKYARGGVFDGPSHSNGGMPVINPRTGQKVAELEGGEPILSRNTYANNRPLIDALLNSSMNHNGKAISWQSKPYQPINFSGITQSINQLKFATGGVFGVTQSTPTIDLNNITEALNNNQAVMLSLIETNKALHKRLQQPIDASVSLKKLDDAYATRSSIKDEAGF
jgi:TP901 family phage tail tape measure protein